MVRWAGWPGYLDICIQGIGSICRGSTFKPLHLVLLPGRDVARVGIAEAGYDDGEVCTPGRGGLTMAEDGHPEIRRGRPAWGSTSIMSWQ